MLQNFRSFAVTDPFGRTWSVLFRWQQNAISIRRCDAVDVKYYLNCEGEPDREMVVALPHADLVDLARRRGRQLTDAWCLRLAGLHVQQMISTWDDMERNIATTSPVDLDRYNREIEGVVRDEAEHAALYR